MGKALKKEGCSSGAYQEATEKSDLQIFKYLDYRKFLKDRVQSISERNPKFTIREFARRTELSASFLSYLLRSQRNLNFEAAKKIALVLGLTEAEYKYFELIRNLEMAKTHDEKAEIFTEIEKSRVSNGCGSGKDPFYSYYSDWRSIVIRELAAFKGFSLNVSKIKNSLKFKVDSKSIKNSINSLLDTGYLYEDAKGNVSTPVRKIECDGEVFKLALREYHSQMLDKTKESLTEQTKEDRKISGITFAVSDEQIPKVFEILKNADDQLRKLVTEDVENKNNVIHVTQCAFRLAKWEDDETSSKKPVLVNKEDKNENS